VPLSSILTDMKSWVGNKTFSDVTLILEAEGGMQVPAHKLLLQRCVYFATMFQSDNPLHQRTSQFGC